ncbi:MAG TPA: efflux RND transporter periplasmic adaptor subunit [Thermoanaerobaculia bacterium]|nr:efflux RND transporter periplasmic adaptor subunit [Thermoanaerobaculia bacterium]
MKKKLIWTVVVLLVVAGVAGIAIKNRGPKPTEVQVAKVVREDLQAKVSANGKIQAQKKVDISATIAGQITNIAVEEGDAVKKGQLLLQIDPVSTRAQVRGSEASIDALRRDVDSARASLEQARADFRRSEGNFKAGIVPAADMERTRTVVATAEATVKAAERRVAQASAGLEGTRDLLAKTTIRSPMDGVVTAKRVEEGEVAVIGIQNSPGTVLFQISDMSVVEAELEVDETSIPNVVLGQEARVRLDAYPNKTFRGTVTEVASSPILSGANQAIKFKVKVRLDEPPKGIKPGLSARADILTGFRSDALVVPLQALVVREIERKPGVKVDPNAPRDQEGVYLMEDGKARFQPIVTGMIGELSIEVLSGLKGGETLITGPFKALRELEPGGVVKIEDPKKKKKAGSADAEKTD